MIQLALEVFFVPPSVLESTLTYVDFIEIHEYYRLRAEEDKEENPEHVPTSPKETKNALEEWLKDPEHVVMVD